MNRKSLAILAAVPVGVLIGILAYVGIESPLQGDRSGDSNTIGGDTEAAAAMRPHLVLERLSSDAENSDEVASYEPDNRAPITLREGDHIRFQTLNNRDPDSMRVIAFDKSGKINVLLKDYDVNNQFFTNVEKGEYELRVEARWFDETYFYSFNIAVG